MEKVPRVLGEHRRKYPQREEKRPAKPHRRIDDADVPERIFHFLLNQR